MSNWRDQILSEFAPNVARLTLVADPDGLLLEERVLEGIRERGFELIPFEDRIAFRYAYESRFRSRWDRGEQTNLVVALHSQAGDLSELPYDLLQAGRRLSFRLGDIFPNLSYPVVTALDRGDLDALYDAQNRYAPGPLGDNATKEFVLRHVFGVASELIKDAKDLMRTLLRLHYRDVRIPDVLEERLIQLLRHDRAFDDWPLEVVVPDREGFFTFLQERWPIFLDHEAAEAEHEIRDSRCSHTLTIGGPADLPFDDSDIRIYINDLFAEGLLRPVAHKHANALTKTWVGIGVRSTPPEDRFRRLERLIDSVQSSVSLGHAKYTDWFRFARGWAEMTLLMNEQPEAVPAGIDDRVATLQEQVDASFASWLAKRYSGLANLPPVPPVMLHHIPRFLARQLGEDCRGKVALVVIDGLAMDQWLAIRDEISRHECGLRFQEQAVFAWIPTVTSVSRQAIFAGKAPVFFPASIYVTSKEPALWTQFWVDQGLAPNEVVYFRGLGDGGMEEVDEALSHPKARVAGLVVDKVDKIAHGMEMGTAGMHNQVRQWARERYLSNLLSVLIARGFRVYLTSDHGNIEAEGAGRPSEGALADLHGERVRVYPNPLLRSKVKEHFPMATEWPPVGLPDEYLALLAPARQAFVLEKEHTVTHGGICMEEVIVPLVRVERRDT
jgi:hypothetical protein